MLDDLYLAYLRRLFIEEPLKPNINTLRLLQKSHAQNIPWENLNIYFSKPVSLIPENIIKKFIYQRRGGICFELNGAYHYLLKKLGFNVKLVRVKIFAYGNKIYLNPRDTHIVNIVEISDMHYLSDVAWDGNQAPILLTDCNHHEYRIKKEGDYYRLYKNVNNAYFLQYQFTKQEVHLAELENCVQYAEMEKDPEREVLNQLLYRQFTTTGYRKLVDNKVIFMDDNIATERQVDDFGGLKDTLIKIFYLTDTTFNFLGI